MSSTCVNSILLLGMVSAVMFAAVIGVVSGFLAKLSGADIPAAILRGGMAFGGAFALCLALMTLTVSVLG
jgi:hypothetical protein